MRPLITEPACLTCHVEQGRKVGDIRGGLSVAVPLAPIWAEQMPDIIHRILGYGGMWLLGLGGIAFLSRKLRQQIAAAVRSGTRNHRTPAGRTMAPGKRGAIPRLLRARAGRHGHPVGRQGVGRSQRPPLPNARLYRRRTDWRKPGKN